MASLANDFHHVAFHHARHRMIEQQLTTRTIVVDFITQA